ncbi:holo-ACP synthase [Bacillus taeanensis]|uniref:Holo-[acyl-carrier-protein] synthase n=1 Tax=Bacillus taeanensis TaxID=273032 RepID=A0A366XP00_9BACI|nr:holo-ACP synthase [Bacillus taeanensis]RBW67842.1 holo-ACP synthase [Bacillus taeanensis]
MIIGIGIDIIELYRIKRTIERNEKFVPRILTPREQDRYYSLPPNRQIEFLAGRFAVKEAYAKARGTGIGKLSFQDIEISSENGKPVIRSEAPEKIFVSISHSKDYAVAQVIIESLSC